MKNKIGLLLIPAMSVALSLLIFNCTGPKKVVGDQAAASTTVQTDNPPMEPGGVQLWANNCNRCHNIPPPSAYNDGEWEAIVNHMQKVGGLTVSEADKIAEYLRASN